MTAAGRNATDGMPKRWFFHPFSIVGVGAVIAILGYRLPLIVPRASEVDSELTAALLAAVWSASCAFAAAVPPSLGGFLIYIGLAVGVMIDVFISPLFGGMERNLFPLEILAVWVIAIPPVVLGTLIGWSVRKRVCRREAE